ncbi:MAG: diacylglycerol/lipid kinase family protein [Devosia sp.]
MHFIGVFNEDGGKFRTMDLGVFAARVKDIMAEHGHTVEIRIVAGKDLIPELVRAAEDPASQALLAGGGDGTISAAAEVCFRTGMPLAVIPAGTMNLFARSLKIPLNPEEAVKALAAGRMVGVDIATANGTPFVHQYSVGIHTRLVRIRESMKYRGRLGKMLASLRAIGLAVYRPPRFDAEIRTKRGVDIRKASGITVSNNLLAEGHIPHADGIDRGVLGVYVVDPMPAFELAKFCLQVLLGTWKGHPLVSEKEVTFVSLRFPKRKFSAQALIDGELVALEKRVDIQIHPRALNVIAPLAQPAVAAA